MNILVIPGWYPSESNPVTGIFFPEQAMAIAGEFEDCNIGISTWGQNDDRLLLWAASPVKGLLKLLSKPQPAIRNLRANLFEFYTPAYTWSRKLVKGNIRGIIKANEKNLQHFRDRVGNVDIIHAHDWLAAKALVWLVRRSMRPAEGQRPAAKARCRMISP